METQLLGFSRNMNETMVKISDLPRDLTEEVLSRLPVICLRAARSTCKKWNIISKDRSFKRKHLSEAIAAAKKKQTKEFQVVMMVEHRLYLYSLNLLNASVERVGKLISLEFADRIDISKIFHCDGLLLCILKDNSRLVVWNPYCGQTRWIEPRGSYHVWDSYALGYAKEDGSCRSYKILRFIDNNYNRNENRRMREFEIFDLNSNSWKVVDVTPDWNVEQYCRGVSLKGNTYWFAQEKLRGVRRGVHRVVIADLADFLLCFDFTTERFGPRLPLPFHSFLDDTVTLSSVKDEQLAVLFQTQAYTMKIWISSKIEPNAVSWRKLFLAVDMKPLSGFQFNSTAASFLVDEKKKVAMVLDKDNVDDYKSTRNIAYIIGKKGYFKKVDLGESTDKTCKPLVCSYVPSSVQIKQASPLGNLNIP